MPSSLCGVLGMASAPGPQLGVPGEAPLGFGWCPSGRADSAGQDAVLVEDELMMERPFLLCLSEHLPERPVWKRPRGSPQLSPSTSPCASFLP